MFEVGIYEAKTSLSKIIKRVQKGEECVITYRGKPAVTMTAAKLDKKEIAAAWNKIRNLRKTCRINATIEEIIAWKNEGRK